MGTRIIKHHDMIVVLNNGHAPDTPGKCSPDKTFKEWEWTREVAHIANDMLSENGIASVVASAEKEKDSLTYPVSVANDLCTRKGADNVLFVSIHVNAAGNGTWNKARGWEVWTTTGKTKSDVLAEHMYNAARRIFEGHTLRTDMSDGDHDKEKDFYVIRKTRCAAVLIENFFMDNVNDLAYLKTDECKHKAAQVILEGVKAYIKQKK